MPGDWSDYLPQHERKQIERRRQRQRWLTALKQRRVLISLCVGVYLLWCLVLLLRGLWFAFSLSVLPIVCMPPLGYLAWWLVWKEFHE